MSAPDSVTTFPPVLIIGQPCLRGVAEVITASYPAASLKTLVSTMLSLLASTGGDGGLSAPQIGLNLQLFVLAGQTQPYINPRLENVSSSTWLDVGDGCMSVPHFGQSVYNDYKGTPRAESFDLYYHSMDDNGNLTPETHASFKYPGDQNIIAYILHEYDHLQGRLCSDYALTQNPPVEDIKQGLLDSAEGQFEGGTPSYNYVLNPLYLTKPLPSQSYTNYYVYGQGTPPSTS